MIDSDQFVYGIWFVPSADDSKDFLGSLVIQDGRWTFLYRFRYYSGASRDPFDGKDRKSKYRASAADDSDSERRRMLDLISLIIKETEREYGEPVDFVLMECRSDSQQFTDRLSSRPWAHVRTKLAEETPSPPE